MIKSIREAAVADKRVLVRCDFNVAVDKEGNITEDFKIRQTVPTIKYLVENNAKVILMSHLDPKSTGMVDKKYTLDQMAQKLSDLLELTIEKEDDCIGMEVEEASLALQPGQVMLLENLRFHKEETENDPEFAKKLSFLGDIYVDDAFGAAHRAHASLVGVPQHLPHFAGLLLEKEMEALDKVMKNPEKPLVAIVGGMKVETKSKLINRICEVADTVIISGPLKQETMDKHISFAHPEKIMCPEDNLMALDIDDKTIVAFSEKIGSAKTILWNGPFGKFEDEAFSQGSLAIARQIIASGAYSVVGGGETVAFLEKHSFLDKFSHVSTGGGAMIAYLGGESMPGIEALKQG